jgi:hypothetical protein
MARALARLPSSLASVTGVRCIASAPPSQRKKIKVTQPVVDLDGDEMTRIIWDEIKKKVTFSFPLDFLSCLTAQPPRIINISKISFALKKYPIAFF